MSTQPLGQTEGSFYARATAAQAAGRYDEAVELLWQASRLGDVDCMSLLGAQLLSGRGARPDPQAGAQLILQAAAQGGGYACALAAAFAASALVGTRPPDWPLALDYLQRSAEVGHEPAQAQLRLLARHRGKAPAGPQAWAQLRRRIDLAAWRKPPPARALSEDPPITAVAGFLEPDACGWIIGRARERLTPAKVVKAGAQVQSRARTNSAARFELVDMDLVLLLVRERLSAACGLPAAAMEVPQALHYAVGEEFTPHLDYLHPQLADQAADIAGAGQRAKTLLIYLNDGFEGGETDFPELGLRFKGGMGEALMFTNILPGGAPDLRLRHAGLPPTSGEKWLFSQWVRDRPAPGQSG